MVEITRFIFVNNPNICVTGFIINQYAWLDLKNIGYVYRQSVRLMNHWKEVLDLPMLEVNYEDLVANQESVSRRIIDFCGLPWHDDCLRFHEAKRSVMTLSYHQVSKPMYSSAVARCDKYTDHLAPLREALEPPE